MKPADAEVKIDCKFEVKTTEEVMFSKWNTNRYGGTTLTYLPLMGSSVLGTPPSFPPVEQASCGPLPPCATSLGTVPHLMKLPVRSKRANLCIYSLNEGQESLQALEIF
ncbi:hypothetical protein SAY86_006619 [Trapa natans]|uniref:Uncharacterized protein n=1 Tax=Trapa natans TaxID=22666 RepID=A0AAN7LDV0_TRANT|nr:hypothetical protein SAY86_006619 [Trapa natans]